MYKKPIKLMWLDYEHMGLIITSYPKTYEGYYYTFACIDATCLSI